MFANWQCKGHAVLGLEMLKHLGTISALLLSANLMFELNEEFSAVFVFLLGTLQYSYNWREKANGPFINFKG